MPIVSVSISKQILEEMNQLQKELGFAGRSELLRASVRMMLTDKRERDELVGPTACILFVTHGEDSEEPVTSIKHEFDEVVKTHLHYKLGKRKCLELFILEGEGEKIKEISRQFQVSRGMERVKLIRA